MAKYRKKPVVVEVIKYTPCTSSIRDIARFMGGFCRVNAKQNVEIETLEGAMQALPGDFIIKGIKGEIYPCKPDIFEATYEKVE